MDEASHRYLIALGSNRRHHRHGRPKQVLRAAMLELDEIGTVTDRSGLMETNPLGPSMRRFTNAAIVLRTHLAPRELLNALQAIEDGFGRKRWRRWGERVLDLDIVLWSGGTWASPDLVIPHPAFRNRNFVLDPAVQIAPYWRDPVTGRTIRQLHFKNSRIGD